MSRRASTRSLLRAPFFSAHGFLLMAMAIAIVFAVAHLAGLRQYTSAISLTRDEGISLQRAAVYCGLWLAAHLAFVLACPVFVLAAAVMAILGGRRASGGGARKEASTPPDRRIAPSP